MNALSPADLGSSSTCLNTWSATTSDYLLSRTYFIDYILVSYSLIVNSSYLYYYNRICSLINYRLRNLCIYYSYDTNISNCSLWFLVTFGTEDAKSVNAYDSLPIVLVSFGLYSFIVAYSLLSS